MDVDNFYLIRNATTIQEIFCEAIFCNESVHSFAKGTCCCMFMLLFMVSARYIYVVSFNICTCVDVVLIYITTLII